MSSENTLTVIVIPDYPDKIVVAKARRPVYYVQLGGPVKGRRTPQKYINNPKYVFKEGVLYHRDSGLPVVANPRTAGKPRYWVVNFQQIWNQSITKQDRAGKVGKLKDILEPYIKKIKPIKTFPVEISITMFDTQCPVDVSNRGAIYTKVIEDLLVTNGKLPDDNIDYVNCSGRTKFIKVENVEEKRMEIRISKSDNNL